MAIGTEELARSVKERYCKMLGIESYEVDYYANVHEKESVDFRDTTWSLLSGEETSFTTRQPPVIHWVYKGNRYSAVVPIKKQKRTWSAGFLGGGSYEVEDLDAMELSAISIISEHIKSLCTEE